MVSRMEKLKAKKGYRKNKHVWNIGNWFKRYLYKEHVERLKE